MAEILFGQNVELCGFNIGQNNISYPDSTSQIEEATENSIVYSFVNNDTYKDGILYGTYQSSALTRDKYIIYRQSMQSDVKTFLATIDGVTDGVWDYNVGTGEKYKYIVETMPSNDADSVNAISLETPYFVNPNWAYWSICDIDKSLDVTQESGVDVYVPSDTVFMMKGNIDVGSINDNIKTIKYDTLGQYGRVVQNQQKYDSGNISCLIGDFEAVEVMDKSKNIITINDVQSVEDFNNVFKDIIIDLKLLNYDNYYFVFPNYSTKYYECKKDIVYIRLESQTTPEQWNHEFSLYYTKISDEQYVNVERQYILVDNIIPNSNIAPPDFYTNYSQYYIKIDNEYIQLTQSTEWHSGTYYTLSSPDYIPGKYYQQIIDYKLVEKNDQISYKYLNSVETLNAWRECVSNGKLKLLKAPNGLKWIISISDQNSMNINWQASSYPTTITFNWQEVIDKNKISIIKW